MAHPLVVQLRFTRSEFVRGLKGLSDADARQRLPPPLADGLSSVGTFMRRTTYHYWYHLGEALAVRQLLGHGELPDFVGDIDTQAPYHPE